MVNGPMSAEVCSAGDVLSEVAPEPVAASLRLPPADVAKGVDFVWCMRPGCGRDSRWVVPGCFRVVS